jgi:hypothetical protein
VGRQEGWDPNKRLLEETLKQRRSWSSYRRSGLANLVVGVCVFWIALWFMARRKGGNAWLVHLLGTEHSGDALGLMVVAVGYVAHRFKRISQRWYGVVEVAFGVASGFAVAFSIDTPSPSVTQWATLIGCAYVLTRGLNNVYDASQSELVEPQKLESNDI